MKVKIKEIKSEEGITELLLPVSADRDGFSSLG